MIPVLEKVSFLSGMSAQTGDQNQMSGSYKVSALQRQDRSCICILKNQFYIKGKASIIAYEVLSMTEKDG